MGFQCALHDAMQSAIRALLPPPPSPPFPAHLPADPRPPPAGNKFADENFTVRRNTRQRPAAHTPAVCLGDATPSSHITPPTPSCSCATPARRAVHGQRRPQHQRLPVLLCTAETAWLTASTSCLARCALAVPGMRDAHCCTSVSFRLPVCLPACPTPLTLLHHLPPGHRRLQCGQGHRGVRQPLRLHCL